MVRAQAAVPVRTGGSPMRRVLASVAALPRRTGGAVLMGALVLLLALAAGCAPALGSGSPSARATATATVAPTTEGRLAQVVRQAVGAPAQDVEATYDAQN